MERYILQYPNSKLLRVSKKVVDFELAKSIVNKLIQIAYEIRKNIYSYPRGFEIAAPQIGQFHRIIILQSKFYKNPDEIETIVMINPQILEESNYFYNWEDCLSVKDMRGCVKRCNSLVVKYQDLSNNIIEKRFTGNIACDIQHGIDHLDGVLYFERKMKYLIPLEIYKPLKEKSIETLNHFVTSHYCCFDPTQRFSKNEMKKLGLIHPRQSLKLD